MFKYRGKKESGFTLIELLVSIFIISLISGSIMVSYFTGQKQYNVLRSTQEFSANLRQVQNMALSGASMPLGCLPADCAKGFGLYAKSNNQYVLFYNSDETKTRYVIGGSKASTDIETITLPNGTSLSPDNKEIYFTPPDPTTYVNGVNSGSQIFTIISGGASKSVSVYSSGLIDIN